MSESLDATAKPSPSEIGQIQNFAPQQSAEVPGIHDRCRNQSKCYAEIRLDRGRGNDMQHDNNSDCEQNAV